MSRLQFLAKNSGATLNMLQQQKKEASGGSPWPESWFPKLSKDKNGYAVIRFLPYVDENDVLQTYWQTIFHSVPNDPLHPNTAAYIRETCPTLIGEQCPICEHNGKLWSVNTDQSKDVARKFGRRFMHFANVLILEDPATPSNVGTVQFFRFGKSILNIITAAFEPKPKYEGGPVPDPIDAFSLFESGADMELIIAPKSGNVNYDRSSFRNPLALTDSHSEEDIERYLSQCKDYSEYVKKDQIKSYDEIDSRFRKHVGHHISTGLVGSQYDDPIAQHATMEAARPKIDTPLVREETKVKVKEFVESVPSIGGNYEDDDIPF